MDGWEGRQGRSIDWERACRRTTLDREGFFFSLNELVFDFLEWGLMELAFFPTIRTTESTIPSLAPVTCASMQCFRYRICDAGVVCGPWL